MTCPLTCLFNLIVKLNTRAQAKKKIFIKFIFLNAEMQTELVCMVSFAWSRLHGLTLGFLPETQKVEQRHMTVEGLISVAC